MILGLMGKAGAGKDTLAELLKPLGFQRLSFADTLYQEMSALTGVSEAFLRAYKDDGGPDWECARARIQPGHPVFPDGLPETPRPALQRYGDYRRAQNVDYFVIPVEGALPDYPNIVITDVRAENEALFVIRNGGTLVRVLRDASGLRLVGGAYAQHRSEVEMDRFPADIEVHNREGCPERMVQELLASPENLFNRYRLPA